jgi:uncharacterized protein
MEIDWDEEKDAVNRAKHGVGLGDAARLEWASAKLEIDERFDYGEERWIANVLLGDRLYICIYTDRTTVRRIISLRKANNRELKRYGIQGFETTDE